MEPLAPQRAPYAVVDHWCAPDFAGWALARPFWGRGLATVRGDGLDVFAYRGRT